MSARASESQLWWRCRYCSKIVLCSRRWNEFRTIDAPSGQRQCFLHCKDSSFHIDVENPVAEVLGDRTKPGILRNTGVCEYNIQPVFLVLDLCKEAGPDRRASRSRSAHR